MLETLLQPQPLLAALGWAHWAFIIPLCLLSVFLTLLILVQRGRGGGLTGALGGMGGQSAFGTKAGDVFTKITIVVAMLWILLSMGALKVLHRGKFNTANTTTAPKVDDTKGTDGKGGTTPLDNIPAPTGTTPPAPVDPPSTPPAPAVTPPAPPSTPEAAPKNDDEK